MNNILKTHNDLRMIKLIYFPGIDIYFYEIRIGGVYIILSLSKSSI